MNLIYQKFIKRERGCEISPTTPVRTCRLRYVGGQVCEAPTAAATECEIVVHDVILRSPAFLALFGLYLFYLCHRACHSTE